MKTKIHLSGEHKLSVILLHGMNNSWKQFNYLLTNPQLKNIKFILINANKINISYPENIEINIRSWYNYYTDYSGLNKYDLIDLKDLDKVNNYLHYLIDQEYLLLGDYSKILIGGSSQGATVAWHSALTYSKPVGGIICLRSIVLNYTPICKFEIKINCYIYASGKDQVYIPRLYNRSFKRLKKYNFNIIKVINRKIDHFTSSKNENKFVTKILLSQIRKSIS